MKRTDHVLQNWRIQKTRPHLFPGAKILDIGSADGALFRQLGMGAGPGSMGIDPTLKKAGQVNGFLLQPGYFPQAMPPGAGEFDAITMLAVLEHFPASGHKSLREGCGKFLRAGGKMIITVPSPRVDFFLKILGFFRLIDGMSLEEHHGYQVDDTVKVFCPPRFRLICHEQFQLGLNNLFVFERTLTA